MSPWQRLRQRYSGAAQPLRTERQLELVLLLLLVIFVLQLLYNALRLSAASPVPALAPDSDILQARAVRATAVVPVAAREELRARPLFWPGRRPVEAVAASAGAAGDAAKPGHIDGVKLLGVFTGGETAGVIALVEGDKQRILRGELVLGWLLDSVQPDRAVFLNGDRREELTLLPDPDGSGTGLARADGVAPAGGAAASVASAPVTVARGDAGTPVGDRAHRPGSVKGSGKKSNNKRENKQRHGKKPQKNAGENKPRGLSMGGAR